MKKLFFTIALFSFFLFQNFSILLSQDDGRVYLVNENFDAYGDGTNPPFRFSDWKVIEDTFKEEDQIVTNAICVSSPNSMKLHNGNGSMVVDLTETEIKDVIFCEGMVRIAKSGTGGIGFRNTVFNVCAIIDFKDQKLSCRIGADNPHNWPKFEDYDLDRWYKFKIEYDNKNKKMSAWIDDIEKKIDLEPNPLFSYDYKYFLIGVGDGAEIYFDDLKVWYEVTDVDDSDNINITSLEIKPNPIINEAEIQYYLEEPSNITLSIVNIYGQTIRTIIYNKMQEQGEHNLEFDTNELPSGIYFCNLNTNNYKKTIKFIVVH